MLIKYEEASNARKAICRLNRQTVSGRGGNVIGVSEVDDTIAERHKIEFDTNGSVTVTVPSNSTITFHSNRDV